MRAWERGYYTSRKLGRGLAVCDTCCARAPSTYPNICVVNSSIDRLQKGMAYTIAYVNYVAMVMPLSGHISRFVQSIVCSDNTPNHSSLQFVLPQWQPRSVWSGPQINMPLLYKPLTDCMENCTTCCLGNRFYIQVGSGLAAVDTNA